MLALPPLEVEESSQMKYSAKEEQKLMSEIWDPEIAEDLEKFVLFMFPWGKEGTPLHNHKEPRAWQRDELQAITAHIKRNKELVAEGKNPEVYQSATASGRGIGKSALSSWLVYWNMSCVLGSTTIVTANTETQLKSRTWPELGKWHTISLNSHWFERSALSLRPTKWYEEALQKDLKIDTGYYYAQAQLWSEEKPDSFAGAHSQYGLMLIMDESSGIPKPIWTVSEGFFTEPTLHRYWITYSNPRRNSGTFFECFHKDRNFWRTRNVDSRTVEGTDIKVFERIIEKHGEDSDEARVEVKGEFPRRGDRQFISRELVDGAVDREIATDEAAPLIMGIDIARYGSDRSVFRWRRGRDARSIEPQAFKGLDNMEVANAAAFWIDKTDPDAVAIDAGNGTGVIDRLREMNYRVSEVWFGGKSSQEQYANHRTEMWGKMREWLKGGCIDGLPELKDDLVGPEYKFLGSSDKIALEKKEDMKRRGIASPDHGDALACTFAVNVARLDKRAYKGKRRVQVARDVGYFKW